MAPLPRFFFFFAKITIASVPRWHRWLLCRHMGLVRPSHERRSLVRPIEEQNPDPLPRHQSSVRRTDGSTTTSSLVLPMDGSSRPSVDGRLSVQSVRPMDGCVGPSVRPWDGRALSPLFLSPFWLFDLSWIRHEAIRARMCVTVSAKNQWNIQTVSCVFYYSSFLPLCTKLCVLSRKLACM